MWKAILRVTAATQPETRYDFRIMGSDSVKDGFGQGLQPFTGRFDTAKVGSFFAEVQSPVLLYPQSSLGRNLPNWEVIARGGDGVNLGDMGELSLIEIEETSLIDSLVIVRNEGD